MSVRRSTWTYSTIGFQWISIGIVPGDSASRLEIRVSTSSEQPGNGTPTIAVCRWEAGDSTSRVSSTLERSVVTSM